MEQILDFWFMFFVYAFLGWVVEVAFHVITKGKFINRGFLDGPYCPIYGFGVTAILYVLAPLMRNLPAVFGLSIVITTLIELVGGFVLMKLFHKRWWDYSGEKHNIKGYICPKFSVYWGIGALIVVEIVHPVVSGTYHHLPVRLILLLDIAMGLLMLIDLASTVSRILGLNEELKELSEMERHIIHLSEVIGEHVTQDVLQGEEEKQKAEEKYELLKKERDEKLAALSQKHRRMLAAFPTMKALDEREMFEKLKSRVKERIRKER